MFILNSRKILNHCYLCFPIKYAPKDFKIHTQNGIVLHLPVT